MQRDGAGRLPLRIGIVLCLAVALAIWWWLDRLSSRANWVQVEAPQVAVVGQSFPLRVHLAPMAEPAFLSADLHWTTNRNTSEGYLASGGAQAVGKEGGVFTFAVPVPPRNGMHFVNGVVFLTRTGDWQTHTRLAVTSLIPTVTTAVPGADTQLVPLRVVPLDEHTDGHPRPATLPRLLTGLLFLLAAAIAWSAGHVRTLLGSATVVKPGWWQALTLAFGLACLWELLGLEHWLGTRARALARAWDLYYSREVFQKTIISLVFAALAASLFLLRRSRAHHRLLFCSFGLYLGISTVNLMSLHVIDTLADKSFHGLSLVQALKLVCAVLTLLGVHQARGAELNTET